MQLRRERGLTSGGDYRLPLVALNRLILQSGLTLGVGKLAIYVGVGALLAFGRWCMVARRPARSARRRRCSAARSLPLLCAARSCAAAGRRSSARNSPTRSTSSCAACAPAIRCRSRSPWWRARLPDPIGTEFGIVADEITYGADLETAMRNLYFRVGQDDLPLFVTAVAIQGSTGGNLGEILENLSAVIRQRFKMRRKIRALAAEGRASAMILSSLPIADVRHHPDLVAPDFYASVWHDDITKIALAVRRRLDVRRQSSSCTAWSISRSDAWTRSLDLLRTTATSTMVALLVFLADRHAGVRRSWRSCACMARSSAAPPASARARRHADGSAARARCGIRASRPRSA